MLVETGINTEGIALNSKEHRNRQSQNIYKDLRINRPRQTGLYVISGGVILKDNTADNFKVTPSISSQPVPLVVQ